MKFHNRARQANPRTVVEAVAKLGELLSDGFAVVNPVAYASSADRERSRETSMKCKSLAPSRDSLRIAAVLQYFCSETQSD